MLLEQEQGKIYPAMVNAMRDINAIAKGENPTAVREKIHVFVSAKSRENVKVKV